MRVKPGYKLTQVGVIPEDWEVRPLSALAEIRSGIAKNANVSVSDPVTVHYLRVANVQDGFLDLSHMSKIRLSRSDLQRYAVQAGDVLMNEGGDLDKLGRGSVWRGEFAPCVHQNHVFVVRCGSKLSPEFLNCWTGSAPARRYFKVAGKQTTNLASINKTALGYLPVILPCPDVQRAIAQALSDIDALIEALERLIAKKRDIEQSAIQQLLTGKRRLPGFGGLSHCWQQSEMGPLPAGWAVRTLGSEIARLDAGVSVNSNEGALSDRADVISVLKTSAVSNGRFFANECKAVAPEDIHRVRTNPCAGSIIISRMNTPDLVGGCGYVAMDYPTLYLPDRLWITRFRSSSDICVRWLCFLLCSPGYKWRIKATATGTSGSMKNIAKDALLALPIPYPKINEQRAIAAVLSDMDAEIAVLERKRDKTRLLKQGMMQELLTGRIRLL